MKQVKLALLWLYLSISAFASGNTNTDITMVSYEQSWLDNNGTLALKNNTGEEVKNISFLITYLDMSGKELDYKEFFKNITIAPGMTKKLDIPAYESDRHYHYYKTKDNYGHPSFKIKFKLKGYNIEKTEKSNFVSEDSVTDDSEWLYIILTLVGILIFISISVGLYILVAIMAQKRNRSVVAWVLLSLIATPLLMIIILLCIGDSQREETI